MGHRVLVADDEGFMRGLLSRVLEPEGFDIVEVTSGGGVLEGVKMLEPDLVILDVAIRGCSSIEVVRAVRAAEYKTPIVMTLSIGQTPWMQDAYAAGATGYIVKPFVPAHALKIFREAIKRGQALASL